jgi:hypothetical protein
MHANSPIYKYQTESDHDEDQANHVSALPEQSEARRPVNHPPADNLAIDAKAQAAV